MSKRIPPPRQPPARTCCYGTGGHDDACPVLAVPYEITPETCRLALAKLGEYYHNERVPPRAWVFALEFAVEVGRRVKGKPPEEP